MFGLFRSPPFRDPLLGELTRSRGHWRGTISLDGARAVPLVLSGARAGPDATALAIAKTLAAEYGEWRPTIENALFEHYTPYAQAIADGEEPAPSDAFPRMTAPGDVWPQVTLLYVAVTPMRGEPTTEFAYRTTWDDDHTLGARFQRGRFFELCGSVLAP